MEFQREPGCIYAEEEGRVIAEVTFPDRDGAADIDHTFVDDTLRVRAWRGSCSGRRPTKSARRESAPGRRVPMPKSGLKGTRRRPICCAPERRREPPRRWEQHGARAAFPATIPVMTGFLCLGTAYGLLMQSKGYGPGWSVLMSAIAFGGSMQFVAVTLLTTAFDPVQAFLLSVMVNARHMFYGLSLLDKYKGLGKVRAFLIYVLCDETFSLVSTLEPPEGVARRDFYFWLSLLDYLYWITGTALGGLLGEFPHL